MPPKRSNTLTEAELRLMKILWRRGESAVTDLVAAMPDGEPLAYNSVLTTIRILEQKGYVEHRQEGSNSQEAGEHRQEDSSNKEAGIVLTRVHWRLARVWAVVNRHGMPPLHLRLSNLLPQDKTSGDRRKRVLLCNRIPRLGVGRVIHRRSKIVLLMAGVGA